MPCGPDPRIADRTGRGGRRTGSRQRDPEQLKVAVEQLSRYLAESDAAAIDYFESAAPHLRTLFGAAEFEQFASLIENYAFSEAYEQLMARSDEELLGVATRMG